MSETYPRLLGSYRQSFTTGAVTTIAAGTSTAGHILALQFATANKAAVLKSLQVEFLLTTAFGAAQEVGFDAVIARSYTAAHTGATALTIDGGKRFYQQAAPVLTGRIANTGALTAGTHTLETNPVAKGSLWCGAIGAQMLPRCYDFTSCSRGGLYLGNQEGIVVRNTILMGATGVGKWTFTVDWDEVDIS